MVSIVTDPFIPCPNLAVICRHYFWSHFAHLRWLNGFHHFGSQKTCYHTRTKFPRNRKATQEPSSHFPKLTVSLTKTFTGSLCNGFRINEEGESFFICRILMTINSICIHYSFMTYQRAGKYFALRKLHHCNTSCAKALIFILIILGMFFLLRLLWSM